MKKEWRQHWIDTPWSDKCKETRAVRKSSGKIVIETDAPTISAVMAVLETVNASSDDDNGPGKDISRFCSALYSVGIDDGNLNEFMTVTESETVFMPSYYKILERIGSELKSKFRQ